MQTKQNTTEAMKLSSLKQKIEELDAKATKGPWYHDLNGHVAPCDGNEWLPTVLLLNNFDRESNEERANLELAALSRTAMPELLRRLLVADRSFQAICACLEDEMEACKIARKTLATIRGEEE